MAYTQAQWVAELRDHLGDLGSNSWTDYQLILASRRAYEAAPPDFYLEVHDETTYTGYACNAADTNEIAVPSAFVGGDVFSLWTRVNQYQPGIAFTATNASTTITTATAHGFAVNATVRLDGASVPGGFTAGATYYVKTVPTSTTMTLSLTSGGAAITATSVGSGFTGLVLSTIYRPWNLIARGVRLDSLNLTAPKIRFARVRGLPYELRIEGSQQLAYPTTQVTSASSTTLTADASYIPVLNDAVYFWVRAPGGFTAATPYYVIAPSGQTFQLSATVGGSAISATTTATYTAFADGITLPNMNISHFPDFMRYQSEVYARSERQRAAPLDRKNNAQRRLLAQQEADAVRSFRQTPTNRTLFNYFG